MKIGILQAGHAAPAVTEAVGDYTVMYTKMLNDPDFTYETWSVVDMEFPAGPEDADGWLISGSKHGAYEDHAFIAPLEDLVRAIYAQGKPLVGVCFGHQIIAQALGGEVVKFDGGWSVGNHTYTFDGREVQLNAWHQDQVIRLPEGATRIGSSPFCENAALLYEGRALTIQPHPEFGPRAIDALIETRGKGIVPDDLLAQAKNQLTAANDNIAVGARLAHFLKTKSLS